MYFPNTTYRIQFHREFTFDDFEKAIPYLHELGIQTIYASPIFTAVPGSTHGYDGLDTNAINPEIGTLEQFKEIAKKLKSLGIGWLQDFVPNHMAYTPLNPKIADVFEHGKHSVYHQFFDFKTDERIMAPFLGGSFEEVTYKKELKIVFEKGQLWFKYFEELFPLNFHGYSTLAKKYPLVFEHIEADIATINENDNLEEYNSTWPSIKQNFSNNIDKKALATTLESASEDSALLQTIHDLQYYRLCYWQETNSHINYRRFFTINGLIGVNIQDKDVFEHYHQLLFQLVDEGLIQGIRIDHVDGLYNPGLYLNQLRERVGDDVYIVVEKILEADEDLPQWPIQGTTGYDLLAQVNNVLVAQKGQQQIARWYNDSCKKNNGQSDTLAQTKTLVLETYMKGEWSHLTELFFLLLPQKVRDPIDKLAVSELIKSMLIACPVYRYYPDDDALLKYAKSFEILIQKEMSGKGIDSDTIKSLIKTVIGSEQNSLSQEAQHFWRKFMQLSGPLMAKGMEDTLMYREHQSMANNEVGDSPYPGGITIEDFHRKMINRQKTYSTTMNATATHDTKRGEDARARLQLLSHHAKDWLLLTKKILSNTTSTAIALPEQYAVLQAVYASMDLQQSEAEYGERLKQYLQKAARESKKYSNWEQPDEGYEQALYDYAVTLSRLPELSAYIAKQRPEMLMQSLAQLILKCTCPGVTDVYQGTELEDVSFVDPDNRRKVDYSTRLDMLLSTKLAEHSFQSLLNLNIHSAKLHALYHLLRIRREMPLLFERGIYQAIKTSSDNTIAFIRRYKNDWLLVVLPLNGKYNTEPVTLKLPKVFPMAIKSVINGEKFERFNSSVSIGVYTATTPASKRNAGVLLPVFSLPAPFGIGDLGKEAFSFATSISRAGQSFLQMLPLNPVSEEQAFSPYASVSAFASSPLYIDVRALEEAGYLTKEEIESATIKSSAEVDYNFAMKAKDKLLRSAYKRFISTSNHSNFKQYCNASKSWLDNYCLYIVLKMEHGGKPWYDWPEAYRQRDKTALENFAEQHEEAIAFEQWKQFTFDTQWQKLRTYCNALNIKLIGDVPFYMAADSADVWAHQSFFAIEADGKMTGVAGVPPDYFSETGQLWGMPVYNWKALQKDKYSWWIQRLQRNVALFDLVRLDHFRAFYDYWEVKGDATMAIEGEWKDGPQASLFNVIKKQFPEMPFIAEDLGEIHEGVFAFRDKYSLPGMRILQFGFENYSPTLRDLPHNYNLHDIAYTGTHDNDTVAGWYKTLNKEAKKAIDDYFGMNVTAKNIAPAMLQALYQSTANTVIAPIQDILGLDNKARINMPSTSQGNWEWIFTQGRLTAQQESWLQELTQRYNRI